MKNTNNPSEKIIIALDGMDKNNVLNLIEKIESFNFYDLLRDKK